MFKKFTMIAVAAAALTTATVSMSASAEAHPRWHNWHPRWHHWHPRWHPQHCVTRKVWRHHHWVVKKTCWVY